MNMIRIDFDQPSYLRASKGRAILSHRLQHLLPGDDEQLEHDGKPLEPVVINRLYSGRNALAPVETSNEAVKGELIPFDRELEDTSEQESSEGVELNFGGVEGKSVTGVYGGSGFAHYRFNKKNGKSFFVRVGKHIIWGIELAPQIRSACVNQGQTISITFLGKQPVTVLKTFANPDGSKREEWINTHKNLWKVEVV